MRVLASCPGALRRVLAAIIAAGAGGCGLDPGMALIPTPERQATVLPSDVPAVEADGYPNVLADPATVPGLPRPEAEVAADEAALEARGARAEAATAGLAPAGSAAELERRGRTHVDETRRAIEAGARPQSDAPPRLSDLPPAALPVPAAKTAVIEEEAGRSLDPAAPQPRTVGLPPFRVAPSD